MSEEKKSVQELIAELNERSSKLKEELMELEKEFNTKKEEFVKIQGALEAFNYVNTPDIAVS